MFPRYCPAYRCPACRSAQVWRESSLRASDQSVPPEYPSAERSLLLAQRPSVSSRQGASLRSAPCDVPLRDCLAASGSPPPIGRRRTAPLSTILRTGVHPSLAGARLLAMQSLGPAFARTTASTQIPTSAPAEGLRRLPWGCPPSPKPQSYRCLAG